MGPLLGAWILPVLRGPEAGHLASGHARAVWKATDLDRLTPGAESGGCLAFCQKDTSRT